MRCMAGRPKDVSDNTILQQMATIHGPATAKELAEAVDMGRSGMNKRLDKLAEQNLIFEKTVGANAKVYWLTPDGYDLISE